MKKNALLAVNDLTKCFGGVVAVDHCTFELHKDSIFALIGPNGSGKTTLFNLITNIIAADRGDVYFKGEQISGMKPNRITQKGIGRTFQIIRVFPMMTAVENMLVVARKDEKESLEKARELLDFVDLLPLENEYAGNLSYGQQKLLEFIRVLMLEPKLVLLDEPFAGINPTMEKKLVESIRELQKEGMAFLIIDHEMKIIMDICEKVFVLDHGKLIAEGSPKEIQENPLVMEAYFGRRGNAESG